MYNRCQLWVSPLQSEEGRRGRGRRLRQKGWSTSSLREETSLSLKRSDGVGIWGFSSKYGLVVCLFGVERERERERSDQIDSGDCICMYWRERCIKIKLNIEMGMRN